MSTAPIHRSLASQGRTLPPMKQARVIDVQPANRPQEHIGRRMYQSAMVNRLTQDWIISVTSANAENLVSAKATRSRSRQLERDNPYYESILKIWENNVIGHRGIRLQMKAKDASGKLDREACKIVADAWEKAGRAENCTPSRNLTRIQVQNLAVRSYKRDGGILFRKRPGFANTFGFALEPIEIDRLDHDLNRPQAGTANQIQFGIETDGFGAPIFFHILTRHPGDVFAYRASPQYRERVPADEIIFLASPKRAGQLIGMPDTTTVMARLNILDKYDQAEAVAAFIASCKGGFLERTNPDGHYEGAQDDQGNTLSELEPGMIEELPPYVSYKPNDPQHPTEAYPHFVKTQLRAVASGSGVTYHDLANDLEGVNFSSIRSGTLEAREEYKKFQRFIIDSLMTPWFEAWLPLAIISGEIPLPISKLSKWNAAEWQGRRWPWIDPLKDVQASIEEVEAGFNSRRRIIAENDDGAVIEEIFEEQEGDNDLAEEHGLDFTQDATVPTMAKGPINPGSEPAKD